MATSLTLPNHIIQFLESGVSITAGSRDARCVPSMARVLACRVDDDGSTVRLWLARNQSEQLRLDCRNNDCIAVVFSQPTTHRTLQVKGNNVAEAPAKTPAATLVDEHRMTFGNELEQVGHNRCFTDALTAVTGELVMVQFTVLELYDQTPGPDAGRKLAG